MPLAGLPKPVVEEYDKQFADGFASGPLGFKLCGSLLVLLFEIFPKTTIIIDALDESNPAERGQLLDLLEEFMNSSENLIKIFISSRDDADISSNSQTFQISISKLKITKRILNVSSIERWPQINGYFCSPTN